MSPITSSTFSSPSAATTDRARLIAGSLKSALTTHPAGPTISASTASPPMGPHPQSITFHPFLDAHPAEGAPGCLRVMLRDGQQPPEVLIAAIEDVPPNPFRDWVSHARLLATHQ